MLVTVLPFVAALVATTVAASEPAPAPSAPPSKLQEIGRVRASVCTPIIVHANGAISQALDNDRSIAILTQNLRAIDFDALNSLQRRRAVDNLVKQSAAVRVSFRGAEGEIKQLRAYAAESTDPTRKVELKNFADALGGAIQRQMRAVEAFDRAVVIFDGRAAAADARKLSGQDTSFAGLTPRTNHEADGPRRWQAEPPESWNQAFREVADALDERMSLVLVDEGVAADHSIAATTGC